MPFAQLVLGSPGAGKSTYCDGSMLSLYPSNPSTIFLTFHLLVQQFMSAIGRKCSVVNLDPANDHTSYECAIDVRSLIKLEDIMAEDDLGPNGGVLYALEELEHNMEWLEHELGELGEDYVLFDCPGQVELYTHHSSLRNIFMRLAKLGYRVCLSSFATSVDGKLCADIYVASSYASGGFLLPHPTVSLHLTFDLVPSSYAPDGPSAFECFDED